MTFNSNHGTQPTQQKNNGHAAPRRRRERRWDRRNHRWTWAWVG